MKWKKNDDYLYTLSKILELLPPLPLLVTKNFYWWVFLWCLKTSGLKKVLLQSGHTNPTPRCTFLTWAWTVACEVDGPSLQPSTWHWYTHLVPPVESWQVACQLVCHPQELEWQLLEQTWWLGLQDLRLQVLWIPEEAVGIWGNQGSDGIMTEEVGQGEGGSTRWLPSEVHKNSLPQIPIWPPWVSPPLCLQILSLCF